MRPHRRQPTRLLHPWDSPGKNTGVGCHFLLQCMKVKSESEVAQSCPTLSDPMDCSPPGSSVHGTFQARILEWVPLPSLLVSYECTYVPFLSSLPPTPPPTPVSPPGHQRAPGWAPVLYGSCPLAIYFTHGNIHISMLLSQSALASASPAVSTSPFSTSALQIGSSVPFF